MRRAARTDHNQRAVVAILRSIGASVELLHAVGKGCPDLLVGYQGRNLLLEVKDGSKPASARKLTPDQVDWHGAWRGAAVVVTSPQEALEVVLGSGVAAR